MANAYLQQQTPTQRDPDGLSAQAASSSRAVERAHSTASQFIKEKGIATRFEIRYRSVYRFSDNPSSRSTVAPVILQSAARDK